ncbi:metallophosphoesterase family protein [Actinoplanes sp. NPDC051470]|uniref:metallophosphoesterase family protein n=1 Tax=Actinoplanes sp. NPDC051470 TaxID=3157224 RepID=UPI003447EF96
MTLILVLHPRATRDPVVQVWIGVFGATVPLALRWQLNGADATPVPVRALSGARPSAAGPRAFTGVYEFRTGITPDTTYTVRVSDSGTTFSDVLTLRTLPAAVPAGGGFEAFNVLLASCFYRHEDKRGFAGDLVRGLPPVHRPDLTLLMGDQVYLDLPALRNFHTGQAELAAKFEEDYVANWGGPGGYAEILHSAPAASIPDDHEYWNNAPHGSPTAFQSLIPGFRDHWYTAARQMYEAFQLSTPGGYRPLLELDVPPLSFFLMDNRTFRDRDRRSTLPPGGLAQFEAWARRVGDEGRFGVVVTGQSLLQGAAGWLKGTFGDRGLADYGDHPAIMRTITGLARRGRPVLCLTGDVHYGRVVLAEEIGNPEAKVYEVISSPVSLVTTPGLDQLAAVRRQRDDPWYRHRAAAAPPATIQVDGAPKLATSTIYPRAGEKGNHLTQLAFRQSGFGLELLITYWMAATDGAASVRHDLDPIRLSPTF